MFFTAKPPRLERPAERRKSYEKMKTLAAEDGLAPSAYRQVNCDLYHVPRPDSTGRGLQNLRDWRDRKSVNHEKRDELVGIRVFLQFCMILFYAILGVRGRYGNRHFVPLHAFAWSLRADVSQLIRNLGPRFLIDVPPTKYLACLP